MRLQRNSAKVRQNADMCNFLVVVCRFLQETVAKLILSLLYPPAIHPLSTRYP